MLKGMEADRGPASATLGRLVSGLTVRVAEDDQSRDKLVIWQEGNGANFRPAP